MLCFKKQNTDVRFYTLLSETYPFMDGSHEQCWVPASTTTARLSPRLPSSPQVSIPGQHAEQQPILSGKGESGNGKRPWSSSRVCVPSSSAKGMACNVLNSCRTGSSIAAHHAR